MSIIPLRMRVRETEGGVRVLLGHPMRHFEEGWLDPEAAAALWRVVDEELRRLVERTIATDAHFCASEREIAKALARLWSAPGLSAHAHEARGWCQGRETLLLALDMPKPRLRAYPMELIALPEAAAPLEVGAGAVIARLVPASPPPPLATPRRWVVALWCLDPTEPTVAAVRDHLLDGLQELGLDPPILIDPRRPELRLEPDTGLLLHLIAHGEEEGGLSWLIGPKGARLGPDTVAGTLAPLLQRSHAVRVDVCKGGIPEVHGLAAALIAAGTRAVIASKERVEPATVEAFSRGYYRTIRETGSVPLAVAAGRRTLRASAIDDLHGRWWTFRLYLGSLEGFADAPPPGRGPPRWRSPEHRRLVEEADALRSERRRLAETRSDASDLERRLRQVRAELRRSGRLQEEDLLAERYRLKRRIGAGSYGTVWHAEDLQTAAAVAIKILHPDKALDPAYVERFKAGARQMMGLRHPNIVSALEGVAEDDGYHYYPMAYIDGPDLDRAVAEGWNVPQDRLAILVQIADALAYAHERGVVHRDIKPSNVLLDGSKALITDFDLARPLEQETRSSTAGPVAYLAPEVGDPEATPGAAADQYAFGMIAILLLGGERALHRARRDARKALLDMDISAELADVLARATSWQPEGRYPSMLTLREALDATRDTPGSPWGRWSRRWRKPAWRIVNVMTPPALIFLFIWAIYLGLNRDVERVLEASRAAEAEAAGKAAEALAWLRVAGEVSKQPPTAEEVDRLIEKGGAVHLVGRMKPGVELAWAFAEDGVVLGLDRQGELYAWEVETGRRLVLPPSVATAQVRSGVEVDVAAPLLNVLGRGDLLFSWGGRHAGVQTYRAPQERFVSAMKTGEGGLAALTSDRDLLVFQDGTNVPAIVQRAVGGVRSRLLFALRLPPAMKGAGPGADLVGLGSEDGFELIRREDGARLWRDEKGGGLEAAGVSPKLGRVALGFADGTLRVRELVTGALVQELRPYRKAHYRVAFSSDGRWLAATGEDGGIALFDTDAWRPVDVRVGRRPSRGRALAFSTDGRWLAYGDEEGQALLVEPNLRRVRSLEGHGRAVWVAAFQQRGDAVLTGSDDGWLRRFALTASPSWLWQAPFEEDFEKIHFVIDHDHPVAVTVGLMNPVTLDLRHGAPLLAVGSALIGTAGRTAFAPETSGLIAIDLLEGTRRLLDPSLSGSSVSQQGCTSPDGSRIVIWEQGGAWRTIDTVTGAAISRVAGPARPTGCLFSKDGRQWLEPTSGSRLHVRDGAGALRWSLDGKGEVFRSFSWSQDGQRIAIGTVEGGVLVLEGTTGKLTHRLVGHDVGETVYALAFSPDGAHLASGSFDGTLRIWDIRDGTTLTTLRMPAGETTSGDDVNDVAFTPDGRWVLAATGEPSVRVFDARTGGLIQVLRGPSTELRRVAVSPDGSMIVATARQGQVAAWRTEDIKPIPTSIEETGRLTNLRVCKGTLEVVAVNPYPDPATVWAPEEACGDEMAAVSGLRRWVSWVGTAARRSRQEVLMKRRRGTSLVAWLSLLGSACLPEEGCGDDSGDTGSAPESGDPPESGETSDTGSGPETGEPPSDVDGDGFLADGGGDPALTDCDDTDPTRYPGAPEVCEDGVVNDCEGSEAEAREACGMDGWSSLTEADARMDGAHEGDGLGYDVDGAGDVDGDGLDDVIVGAIWADVDGITMGAAYVYLGAPHGVVETSEATARLVGGEVHGAAGDAVAGLGDLDADGYADLIVGAQYESHGGAAYVVNGPVADDLSLPFVGARLLGEGAGDNAGVYVAAAGDTNGDGSPDVLVGAEGAGDEAQGIAYLLLGPTVSGGSLARADARFIGEDADDDAGVAQSAGDVDGDGMGDILVGASFASNGSVDSGAAYVVLGPSSGDLDLADADAKLAGVSAGQEAGLRVAGAGDTDGDGYPDVLVGAPDQEWTGACGAGGAYLVVGGLSLTGTRSLSYAEASFAGGADGDCAGRTVDGPGDLDGDGHTDVLVAAPFKGDGYTYITYGPLSGAMSLDEADLAFYGDSAGAVAGADAGGAGDVNGDGRPDLVIGSPQNHAGGDGTGSAYLLYGSSW